MITEEQKRAAQAIVNIFETGSATGDYGNVTLIPGDPGHLTYGRSQTTLGSGNLYLLMADYCAAPGAKYGDALKPYLDRVKARDLSLDHDSTLKSLLKQAGADPVMHTVQDTFFDRVYWTPAANDAQALPVSLPLSVAVVYDSHIHGSWPLVRDKTIAQHGTVSSIGEKPWIGHYIQTRRNWLANHSITILHATVYRMDAFRRLIEQDNWQLQTPMRVRDVTITPEMVAPPAPPLKLVMLADNSVVPCNPRLEGDKTRVDMRPVCESMKVALPEGDFLKTLHPEVIPPGITRVNLRPLVEHYGWELLTHKMAEEGKIYLRKKA
jgi:chitosanase